MSHDSPRSDVTLNTENARPLETVTSPLDLSSLPTETLLKVLDAKRSLDFPLDYKFGSMTSKISNRKPDLDPPVAHSSIVPRMMNHIRGTYPGSPSWSTDLEAIDWTLQGKTQILF